MAEKRNVSLPKWYEEGKMDAGYRKEKWEPLHGWGNPDDEKAYAKGWNEELMLKLLEGR